jgi:hypothetical protein
MTGTWHNLTGYTLRNTGCTVPGMGDLCGLGALWGWRRERVLYEFTLDAEAPLTFQHPSGFFIQPDRHGYTDLGSVPEVVELWFPRNEFEADYIVHDSGCREHGLYVSQIIAGPYTFAPMTSREVHDLLGMTVDARGRPSKARAIRLACLLCGPRWR